MNEDSKFRMILDDSKDKPYENIDSSDIISIYKSIKKVN